MILGLFVWPTILLAGGQSPELQAVRWFNNPVFRLEDDRKVLLFFFDIDPNKDARETLRHVEQINVLTKQKDWVVIGLTSARPSEVESFIREHRVRFTVGAGSKSSRDYKVDRFPRLIVVDRKSGKRETGEAAPGFSEMDLEALTRMNRSAAPQASDFWPELSKMDVAELRDYLESDAHGMDRAGAVGHLFEQMGNEEFVRYAEDRIKVETDPWARGKLRYYAEVARGVRADDDGPSPSARALTAMNEDPTNEIWAPIRAYEALPEAERADADKVFSIYQSSSGDSPVDSLIRRAATTDLWRRCASSHQPVVRKRLLQIAAADPDASIRMIACMALGKVCAVGDTEAADFLESLAEHEPETVRTKPMMEYVSHYLRTGQEESETMTPRP